MNKVTYTQMGDYLYPDLILPEQEALMLGKYGRMHKAYLKKNHKAKYNQLLLSGQMDKYLSEIDQTAQTRLEILTKQMMEENNVNESLKATDQMQWVGLMNNLRQAAEEIILNELIYN